MSQQIICKECSFSNPPGSKFCNNCGTKLPLGTHIICGNCGNSNPVNRVFCDECGSRLIPEVAKPEEKPKDDASAASSKAAFSLPVRKPGETGDLDPRHVPDWLKTGKKNEDDDELLADDELPRIEDLTRDKNTGDLPDWLVDEEDSDPIIRAPTIISTEFYKDLLDRSDLDVPQPEDLFPEEDANLPDWLRDVSPTAVADTPAATDKGLTNWLSELDDDDSEPDDDDEPISHQSLTGWLTDQAQPAEDDWLADTSSDSDLTSWLAEEEETAEAELTETAGASLTNWLSHMEDEEEPDAAEDDGGLTDWLTAQTGQLSDAADEPDDALFATDSGLTEWLSDPEPEAAEPDIRSKLTDWLSDLSDEDEPATAVSSETGLSGWLSADEPELVADADEADDDDWDLGARLTDWLSEEEANRVLPADKPVDQTEFDDDWLWADEATDEPDKTGDGRFDESAHLAGWFDQAADEADAAAFEWQEESELPLSVEAEPGQDLNWLDESEEELASIFQGQPTTDEALPDWLSDAADGDPLIADVDEDDEIDLAQIFGATGNLPTAVAEDDFFDALADADEQPSDAIMSDEPDWLAALTAVGSTNADLPADEAHAALVDDLNLEEAWPSDAGLASEADLDEWGFDDAFPVANDDGSSLPAWISQLDSQSSLVQADDAPVLDSEDLPDWIASLRPNQEIGDSVLPGAFRADLPDSLAGIPTELVGADLPNWLQDIPHDAADMPAIAMPADTQMSDIPDWLQPGLSLDESGADIFSDSSSGGTVDMTGVGDEWSAILDDLPPAVPLEDMLSKAEIPEWVMALKPSELTGTNPQKIEDIGPEETIGPLSGLRGVVTVEPAIALPRVAQPIKDFTVSPEQQQQVSLLMQLSQEGRAAEAVDATGAGRDISGWLRPLFAILLLLAIVLGLRGVVPVQEQTVVPVHLLDFQTAVQQAAGQNVLLAFEYSPAMSAELTPAAELLMHQLAANGSHVVTISQFTAGVPLAEQLAGDSATHLGYLSGGAIGLRWFGECLSDNVHCDMLFAQSLTAVDQQALQDVGLVVLLTAEHQSLVNWIEQVGGRPSNERPLVVVSSQALAPTIRPYRYSGQVAGMLAGLPDIAAYQQIYFGGRGNDDIQKLFNAQLLGQLLLVGLLLVGILIYSITGLRERRR